MGPPQLGSQFCRLRSQANAAHTSTHTPTPAPPHPHTHTLTHTRTHTPAPTPAPTPAHTPAYTHPHPYLHPCTTAQSGTRRLRGHRGPRAVPDKAAALLGTAGLQLTLRPSNCVQTRWGKGPWHPTCLHLTCPATVSDIITFTLLGCAHSHTALELLKSHMLCREVEFKD